jgi:hypothetical protein
MSDALPDLAPLCRFATYPADAIRAITGANEGDPIGLGDAALPGDTYRLHRDARPARLAICDRPGGGQAVARGSEVGQPGDPLTIADCHHFMAAKGQMIEVLVLKRDSATDGTILHLLPLSPLDPGTEYDLIGSFHDSAPERFADIASVSFFAGTQLTLAGGAQARVEDLAIGDLVLTRDHGPRPIRWIGQQTRRATGAAAPIRIARGTLNTARDLRLSPQHRLFIWQRDNRLGSGRAEVLVRADLLVNGTTVTREEGGHVDSFLILFDSHEIIFAEGIPVESLLVTSDIRARLPEGLALSETPDSPPSGIELDETMLGDSRDAAARLTRANRGHDPD